ncbi:hypothetical protein PABG_02517 [Paracoccidioides brasiliensis Pb03]|nr:hypothetical protein PABG_02517 [Paracoccidioides brasiliensis Pb03]
MPGEVIDIANPKSLPSHLPPLIDQLAVQLSRTSLDENVFRSLQKFQRAANYIAAAMIFLQDNAYLKRELKFDDIKPRLLGHWGTCPGLTFVYSHLNYLISQHDLDMIYVVGPGHGAPGILAALWLEGSLERFYPDYARNAKGLTKLVTSFSTPGGFPSHINAETPGAIHEGGELGYALSVAFGAVMDKPDLIATCIIGDGEAETGPTAASWHGFKFLDPAESGAVLPILHLNGFKISERTIFGCMDDRELVALFAGYGYHPQIIDDLEHIDADFNTALEWTLGEIRKIQKAARSGNPVTKPRWPILILRTPKGWTSPKQIHGQIIEGSFKAHQVPLPAAKTDEKELKELNAWLFSYKPAELFTEDGGVSDDINSIIPRNDKKKLGQRDEVYESYKPFKLADWRKFGVEKGTQESSMKAIAELIDQVFVDNPHSIRLFSPDELESNKLGGVLAHTGRNFQWDQFSNAKGGRVIEVLSEHLCQGFLQGYTLTGRVGIFPSYESFLGIIHTMMVQFCKFTKMGRDTSWRRDIASINYIETSTWTRQEHNGFSHQNPSFISAVLNLKTECSPCLPATRRKHVSLHIVSLSEIQELYQPHDWIQAAHTGDLKPGGSRKPLSGGRFDEGRDPDVVLAGIGTELTFEVIQAAALLRKRVPELRVRVVNVTDLMILGAETGHPHALSDEAFNALFTADRPIHFNYHGYETEMKGLLFGRQQIERVTIASYMEEGSTTTPFDMMLANRVSRFHVAQAAVRGGAVRNEGVRIRRQGLLSEFDFDMNETLKYISEHHKDPDDMYDMPKFSD